MEEVRSAYAEIDLSQNVIQLKKIGLRCSICLEDNISALKAQVAKLEGKLEISREAMQDFVDKVERGEARSKRSYAKFKVALLKLSEIGRGGVDEK